MRPVIHYRFTVLPKNMFLEKMHIRANYQTDLDDLETQQHANNFCYTETVLWSMQ